MLIVIIVLAVIIFFVMIGNKEKEQESNPLDILKKRLASGEIDIEEYEKLKKNIL